VEEYAVVYRGRVIGHTALGPPLPLVGSRSGDFRPTGAFATVEPELRPYGLDAPGVDEPQPPPSDRALALRDAGGRLAPVADVRLMWPGGFLRLPGFRISASAPPTARSGEQIAALGEVFVELERVYPRAPSADLTLFSGHLIATGAGGARSALAALRALPGGAGREAAARAIGCEPDDATPSAGRGPA